MFYSLKEAAEKLNMTEAQVANLVKERRLSEFRVGENVSFKASEVDALAADPSIVAAAGLAEPEPATQPELIAPPQAAPPPESVPQAEASPQPAGPEPEPQAQTAPQPEPVPQAESALEPAPPPEPVLEAPPPEPVPPRGQAVQPEPSVEAQPAPAAQPRPTPPPQAAPQPEQVPPTAADSGEISLVSDGTGELGTGDELLDADTFVASEGINVLGETHTESLDTGDMLAETKGSGAEPSLEEIEEDVNLDTFGSGSGLLDLSLQADDTSLGGILDEIYTSDSDQDTSETGALDLVADSGPAPVIVEGEEFPEAEPVAVVEEMHAAPQVYAAAPPDKLSNWLGFLLFLPLLAVIYTAIVAIAGFNNVMPAVLGKMQGTSGPYGIHIIWYVAAGAIVLTLAVVGLGSMGGGPKAGTAKKAKPKKEKVKKEKVKKPKKPKKPKEPKKKKEKKK
jgi:excisionase family DNA binding protein